MPYNPFSLTGKRVLVTGASSGIGQATAIECSKMGATLVITGRNEERLNETFSSLEGTGHQKIIADLLDPQKMEELVQSIPSLDGIALCSGLGMTCPFAFATQEKFDRIFDTNFFSTVELLRLLVKNKKLLKESSVVLVSSIGGVYKYTPGNSIYDASKSAIHSMMKSCAIELAPKKIRVNSLNPGMVETPLIKSITITEEQFQKDIEKYLLKRYGKPEEIAYGIIYLLSEASAWVTGHALVIDGGVTVI